MPSHKHHTESSSLLSLLTTDQILFQSLKVTIQRGNREILKGLQLALNRAVGDKAVSYNCDQLHLLLLELVAVASFVNLVAVFVLLKNSISNLHTCHNLNCIELI